MRLSIGWSSRSEQVNCDQVEQPGWETADETDGRKVFGVRREGECGALEPRSLLCNPLRVTCLKTHDYK